MPTPCNPRRAQFPTGTTPRATGTAPHAQPWAAVEGRMRFGQPCVGINTQAGVPRPSPSWQPLPSANTPFSPLAATQARERRCGTARRMGAGSILPAWGCLLHRSTWRTSAPGPTGMSEGPAGTQPLLSPGDERASPSSGTALCLQPKASGRPAASAAAGTNACTYLCPSTGVCSSLPRR